MILKEFSTYLKSHNDEILSGEKTTVKLLCDWIRKLIHKTPKTNVEKIIHTEIILAENKNNEYMITGKSESGRVLVKALYNFALSYEQYIMQKWLEDKKPDDFKNIN